MIDWHSKNVIVTGVTSPLGLEVSKILFSMGANVHAWTRGLPRDLGLFRSVSRVDLRLSAPQISEEFSPAAIFHLAAAAGDRATVRSNPLSAMDTLAIDLNTLSAAHRLKPTVFMYASSATVYPTSNSTRRCDETIEMVHDRYRSGPPYDPDSLFGWAKLTTELLLEQTELSHGIRCIPARLFTLYDHTSRKYGVVGKWIAQAASGEDLLVFGGPQVRTFTHVHDAARALVLASQHAIDFSGGFDVGGADCFAIAEAAQLVAEAYGVHSQQVTSRAWRLDSRNQEADLTLLHAWGWEPIHNLRQTVREIRSSTYANP